MQTLRRIISRWFKVTPLLLMILPVENGIIFPAMAEERLYKVETAYLYNFFNYITWPGLESPQQLHNPVICVVDNDPLLPYLEYIKRRMAQERNLTVRAVADPDEASGCHILFIRHRMSAYLLNALPPTTLVVFKPDDPLDRGGMIELSEDGERLSLKINRNMLENKGFQVSSRLLNLAQQGP